MIRVIVFLIYVVLLAGCGGADAVDSTQLMSSETTTQIIDAQINLSVDSINLQLRRPEAWEIYETEYGVVLAEYISSVAVDRQLSGLLTHVFVPPLDEFNIQISATSNPAFLILSQITSNPDYVGSATISDPVAFDWDGLSAAYYLMDNGEGNVTIVVGVVADRSNRLVACSISAPADQSDRIREALPQLLDGLMINGQVLAGDSLNTLPNPLHFPTHQSSYSIDAPEA